MIDTSGEGARAAAELAKKARRLKKDYEAVFESPQGKRVLADLRHVTGAARSTYDPNMVAMAVNEGMRRVWLHIEHLLTLDDEKLRELVVEHRKEEGV